MKGLNERLIGSKKDYAEICELFAEIDALHSAALPQIFPHENVIKTLFADFYSCLSSSALRTLSKTVLLTVHRW